MNCLNRKLKFKNFKKVNQTTKTIKLFKLKKIKIPQLTTPLYTYYTHMYIEKIKLLTIIWIFKSDKYFFYKF